MMFLGLIDIFQAEKTRSNCKEYMTSTWHVYYRPSKCISRGKLLGENCSVYEIDMKELNQVSWLNEVKRSVLLLSAHFRPSEPAFGSSLGFQTSAPRWTSPSPYQQSNRKLAHWTHFICLRSKLIISFWMQKTKERYSLSRNLKRKKFCEFRFSTKVLSLYIFS